MADTHDNPQHADGNLSSSNSSSTPQDNAAASAQQPDPAPEESREEQRSSASTGEENQAAHQPADNPKQAEKPAPEEKEKEIKDAKPDLQGADSPEKPTDQAEDDLEQEDDTQEIQGDDAPEEGDQHPEEQELPDYGTYSPEALVQEARKLIQEKPVQQIKEAVEAIKKSLLDQLDEEREAKLQAFVEEGGNEIDFAYVQPLREEFRSLYRQYRRHRKEYYDRLRAELEENLRTKQGLIEQLKELVNKEESIGETFKEFNAIVQEWRNTGPVPRMESRDLWRTWHHHVENFYEYIKINKELRDLDYKKNLEKKEALIKQAEELLEWKALSRPGAI